MKKCTIGYIIALLLCFPYTSCKNPPIFAAIEQEVKLKKASVLGFIRGITQIDDTLYVSNGKLFTKTVGDTGRWTSIGCPGNAGSLATDGTNLYGVFDGSAYTRTGTVWQRVDKNINIVGGTKTVFGQDNSKKIYTISGPTAHFVADGNDFFKGAAGNFCITEKGVYDSSGLKSGSGTPTLGLIAICAGEESSDDHVFILTSGTLYAYNGTAWTSIAHSQAAPQSVTYLKDRKLVLISGAGGFSEIKLDNADQMNLGSAKRISVGSSDSSVPASCYHQYLNSIGKWHINPIYSVKMNSNYILYAGVLDSNTKYTGLWGFYNPGQTEWNRE
ncbi:MAG: hypothetical protein ACTTH8_02635 [Treponema sp.]